MLLGYCTWALLIRLVWMVWIYGFVPGYKNQINIILLESLFSKQRLKKQHIDFSMLGPTPQLKQIFDKKGQGKNHFIII